MIQQILQHLRDFFTLKVSQIVVALVVSDSSAIISICILMIFNQRLNCISMKPYAHPPLVDTGQQLQIMWAGDAIPCKYKYKYITQATDLWPVGWGGQQWQIMEVQLVPTCPQVDPPCEHHCNSGQLHQIIWTDNCNALLVPHFSCSIPVICWLSWSDTNNPPLTQLQNADAAPLKESKSFHNAGFGFHLMLRAPVHIMHGFWTRWMNIEIWSEGRE